MTRPWTNSGGPALSCDCRTISPCLPAFIARLDDGAAGLRLVAEAAQIAERTSESWCDAELERERAELLLLDPSNHARSEADAAFKRAIDIAVAQGAKMLELRASAARAGLWAERGEPQRAFDILSPIYDWFTEGFETPGGRSFRRGADNERTRAIERAPGPITRRTIVDPSVKLLRRSRRENEGRNVPCC